MKVISRFTETEDDFTYLLAIRFSKEQYEWLKRVAFEDETDLDMFKKFEDDPGFNLAFIRGLVSYADLWDNRDDPEVAKILTDMAIRQAGLKNSKRKKKRKKSRR